MTGKALEIRPITFRAASDYINQHHRHHNATVGCKFAISLWEGTNIRGVAVCGRPVSRYYDDGRTLEINRVCTDGVRNGCSMLYGACVRIARNMGYHRVITYTLASENGASLKASGFIDEGIAGGTHWTGIRDKGKTSVMKHRWTYMIKREV